MNSQPTTQITRSRSSGKLPTLGSDLRRALPGRCRRGGSLHLLHRLPILVLIVALLLTPSFTATFAQAACADSVVVQPGDTLSAIAARTLGSYAAYSRIVSATNAAAAVDPSFAEIDDPGRITVGWKLCIPDGAVALSPTATPAASPAAGEADSAAAETAAETETPIDGKLLTIDYLRSLDFSDSRIVVEQTLAAGSNYSRYIASYQSEGFKVLGLLTVPNGEQPTVGWPAIIFNHGYIPPEVYRTTERYVAYQDGFARNGYVTFKPDYRGHGFSEGEARGAYGRPDFAVDVLNAAAAVKRLDYVDADRIGMWGHSMGGYLTLRAMVVDPDIKVGVIWAGVVASYPDLMTRWTRSAAYASIPARARRWRQELQEQYGTPAENPEFWASISANSYLADLSGPIQLHHGTADGSVPILFSELLYDQIQAAGGAAEFFRYADDDHNLAQQFNTAMARSIAYFDAHLK